ncbi:hypothetical protein GGX14DRAFT_393336 [Mycena pura]|uniref:Uncharacterized protein n=1 Tax=Mycena pura TaxID=153505 RepID=A0AAD6YEZ1_9AGAR|nr:hypothetical protein GGX14DRAFT_393336 [Mycena pura]
MSGHGGGPWRRRVRTWMAALASPGSWSTLSGGASANMSPITESPGVSGLPHSDFSETLICDTIIENVGKLSANTENVVLNGIGEGKVTLINLENSNVFERTPTKIYQARCGIPRFQGLYPCPKLIQMGAVIITNEAQQIILQRFALTLSVQIGHPEKKGFVLNQNCMDSLKVLNRYVALDLTHYPGQKTVQESAGLGPETSAPLNRFAWQLITVNVNGRSTKVERDDFKLFSLPFVGIAGIDQRDTAVSRDSVLSSR